MSRPSKLTPELQDLIAKLIQAGNTVEIAAEVVGISEETFYGWMVRGRRSGRADKPYREFRGAAVERARAQAEATLVSRIAIAARQGSWRAATWLLEHRYPERWATSTARKHDATSAALQRGGYAA